MSQQNNDEVMKSVWDEVAEAYQRRYAIHTKRIHYGPLSPSEDTLQLLGVVNDSTRVIELGSGAGQNAIVLAKQGAKVTAIDISKEQIKFGKGLADKEGVSVEYIVGSFLDFTGMGYEDEVDIVLSVYALQYCADQSEMDKVCAAVYKALKQGGRFVFSLDHPIRAHGSWQQDSFVVDNYFDREQKSWKYNFPEAGLSPQMVGSFKTLQDYFSALVGAGFGVAQILEPEPIREDDNSDFGINSSYGVKSVDDPFSYAHLSRIPGTLIFQAFKE